MGKEASFAGSAFGPGVPSPASENAVPSDDGAVCPQQARSVAPPLRRAACRPAPPPGRTMMRGAAPPLGAGAPSNAAAGPTTPPPPHASRGPETGAAFAVADGGGGPAAAEPDSAAEASAWLRSPVPLDKEEAENAAVRALAAKLAPALEEAAALIATSVPADECESGRGRGSGGGGGDDDNDSLDGEVDALRYSEVALREELELANDFSNLFHRSPPRSAGDDWRATNDVEDGASDDDGDSAAGSPPPGRVAPFGGATPSLRAAVAAVAPRRLASPRDAAPAPMAPPPEADVDPSDFTPVEASAAALAPIPLTGAAAGAATTPSARTTKAPDGFRSDPSKAPASPSSSLAALHDILIPAVPAATGASSPGGGSARSRAYTQSEHFAHLRLAREEQAWYSLDWTPHLAGRYGGGGDADDGAAGDRDGPSPTAPAHVPGVVKEFCLTLPDSKLKTLFVGLPDHHVRSGAASAGGTGAGKPSGPPSPASPAKLVAAPARGGGGGASNNAPGPQDLPVRTVALRIRGDVLCGSVTDAVVHALLPPGAAARGGRRNDPLGLSAQAADDSTLNSADDSASVGAPLAAASASSNENAAPPLVRIQKRQGGHLQAIVGGFRLATVRRGGRRRGAPPHPPATPPAAAATAANTPASSGAASASAFVTAARSHPPFFLDAQICTQRSEQCERVLLLRIYHLPDPDAFRLDLAVEGDDDDEKEEEEIDAESVDGDGASSASAGSDPVLVGPQEAQDAEDERQSWRLREACALIQRVESPRKAKRIRVKKGGSSPVATRGDLREAVSDHLRSHYQACPSAREGGITLPALNSDDWPVVVASWRWIRAIWDELDSRYLSYRTLTSTRFGAFPALPSLDVHYCSQIRRLSREDMVVQLLRSASELEDYAREAEYACANLVALLQPAFETYGIAPPALPRPTPLTAYPLDFVAPQQTCPPWGQLVMEALNQIQSWVRDGPSGQQEGGIEELWFPTALSPDEARNSLALAERAVQLVWSAFQTQDDEEKSARLGRKNLQVMDRLAKMQEHERLSLTLLDRAYLTSEKATKAADDFQAKSGGIREVPLLKWSVVVGGSTGTCLVTARHILFVTQLIPYFGGSKSSLWKLQDVYFTVQDGGTPSLLNPLPTIISVKARGGEEVYAFRPSSGGARLKSFLDLVQTVDVEAASDVSLGGSDASS